MSMIGIRKHLIRTSLILRSGGLFLTPTRSITCSIIRSLVIVTITWNERRPYEMLTNSNYAHALHRWLLLVSEPSIYPAILGSYARSSSTASSAARIAIAVAGTDAGC